MELSHWINGLKQAYKLEYYSSVTRTDREMALLHLVMRRPLGIYSNHHTKFS